jgi:hypothetical protein
VAGRGVAELIEKVNEKAYCDRRDLVDIGVGESRGRKYRKLNRKNKYKHRTTK